MFRVGQIWVDDSKTSAFTILRLRDKNYTDGGSALRVKGVLVTGVDGSSTHLRDLDSRSVEKMFPIILFEPERGQEDTENK